MFFGVPVCEKCFWHESLSLSGSGSKSQGTLLGFHGPDFDSDPDPDLMIHQK